MSLRGFAKGANLVAVLTDLRLAAFVECPICRVGACCRLDLLSQFRRLLVLRGKLPPSILGNSYQIRVAGGPPWAKLLPATRNKRDNPPPESRKPRQTPSLHQ